MVEMPTGHVLRLFGKLSGGVHVTGSARTPRSLADQPEGPFRYEQVAAPGELMQIDSTPLDVLVRLDEGVPGRVELCGLVDVATRTIAAAVVRPTTNGWPWRRAAVPIRCPRPDQRRRSARRSLSQPGRRRSP